MDSTLQSVVRRGHLCPACGLAMLKIINPGQADEHVACLSCTAEYRSFKELFKANVEANGWPDDSWERWLAWNEYDGEK